MLFLLRLSSQRLGFPSPHSLLIPLSSQIGEIPPPSSVNILTSHWTAWDSLLLVWIPLHTEAGRSVRPLGRPGLGGQPSHMLAHRPPQPAARRGQPATQAQLNVIPQAGPRGRWEADLLALVSLWMESVS